MSLLTLVSRTFFFLSRFVAEKYSVLNSVEQCQISVTKVKEISNRVIFAVYKRKIITNVSVTKIFVIEKLSVENRFKIAYL